MWDVIRAEAQRLQNLYIKQENIFRNATGNSEPIPKETRERFYAVGITKARPMWDCGDLTLPIVPNKNVLKARKLKSKKNQIVNVRKKQEEKDERKREWLADPATKAAQKEWVARKLEESAELKIVSRARKMI